MLQIDDAIVSLALIERKFACDLSACKGSCCRYGDTGAPLTAEEAATLDRIWQELKPYIRPEGIGIIEKDGTSMKDIEGELVTPLINNEECAYAILEDGIYKCGIEKAWSENKISFRKPLSCHLFPVRIKQYSGFKAVNYEELQLCASACNAGRQDGIFLFEFLKEPLIRAFGITVYNELCIAAAGQKNKL